MTVLLAGNDGTPICLKGVNPDEDWIVFTQEDADWLEAILTGEPMDRDPLGEEDGTTSN